VSNPPPKTERDRQAAFRFKGQGLLAIAELLVSVVFAIPIVLIEKSRGGPPSVGEIILALMVLLFVLGAIMDLRQKSDIVVNEKYISRRLFGWSWKKIYWNEIHLIKVIPFFHPALRKVVRIISIQPSTSPRFRLLPYRKMNFSDQAENMNDLIAIINNYAAVFHIKIQTSENPNSTTIPDI
jgi:hypothetical protein